MSVTLNVDQQLYVISEGNGFSCLGFDVLVGRYNRLAAEMGKPLLDDDLRGTMHAYNEYAALLAEAGTSGKRFECELSSQLRGLEGRRVEVIDMYGQTRRFIVGKSTGWLPIHLEIKTRRSYGGDAAASEYASVRDLGMPVKPLHSA